MSTGPEPERTDSDDDVAGPERSLAFSDGVFAIAITLLILPLTDANIQEGQVATDLRALGPQLFTFALSFLVIGRYWVGHHDDLGHVARVDHVFLWLNLVFLFFIVFLPFPTSVLGDHSDPAGVVLYAATIVGTALSSLAVWLTAGWRGLLRHDRPPGATAARVWGTLAVVVTFAASIPVALLAGERVAQFSWLAAVPLSVVADHLPAGRPRSSVRRRRPGRPRGPGRSGR